MQTALETCTLEVAKQGSMLHLITPLVHKWHGCIVQEDCHLLAARWAITLASLSLDLSLPFIVLSVLVT